MTHHDAPVVIITGATGVIGSQLAAGFGRDGWRVAVAYHRNEQRADELVASLRAAGLPEAAAWQIDLADRASGEALVSSVTRRWGRLDALVGAAGIARAGLVSRLSEADWDAMWTVNLTGSFQLLRLVARRMMEQRSGLIISIGSLLGVRGAVGAAGYAASKAAFVELSLAAAQLLGPHNIRVNAVLPGFHESALTAVSGAGVTARARQDSCMNRTTEPAELVRLVLFLAHAASITGQVFNCDSRLM